MCVRRRARAGRVCVRVQRCARSLQMMMLGSIALWVNAAAATSAPLPKLNVDPETVVMTGLGDSADFAHQFHIAFSALVHGACIFSGQPFNCAVAGNAGDSLRWHADILANSGAASSTNDHCKSNPDVVDVGSLVVSIVLLSPFFSRI
jgi:hypothetical protein